MAKFKVMVAIADRVVVNEDRLRAFCKRWRITRLSAFGSVLRGDFGAESDLDVLADFEPAARHTMFQLQEMEAELSALTGRYVDFVERRAIERSPNYLRRREILGSSKVFFDVG